MTRPRPTLPALVKETTARALSLALVVGEASAIQWSPSPVPKPRDDTSERSKGGHGDPTLATVVDERRLALRAEVEAALDSLSEFSQGLDRARSRVSEAILRWEGGE